MRVRYEGHTYTLTRRAAAIGVDIDGSVARAEAASAQGSMFTRTWRGVRGEQLNQDLDAKITYSRRAVRKLVRRVSENLDKEPVDAKLDLGAGKIDPHPVLRGPAGEERAASRAISSASCSTRARAGARPRRRV